MSVDELATNWVRFGIEGAGIAPSASARSPSTVTINTCSTPGTCGSRGPRIVNVSVITPSLRTLRMVSSSSSTVSRHEP